MKTLILALLLAFAACCPEPPPAGAPSDESALGYWEVSAVLCDGKRHTMSIDLEQDGVLLVLMAGEVRGGAVTPMAVAGAALGAGSATVRVEEPSGARWDVTLRDGGIDPETHVEFLDATVSYHAGPCAVTTAGRVDERVR